MESDDVSSNRMLINLAPSLTCSIADLGKLGGVQAAEKGEWSLGS